MDWEGMATFWRILMMVLKMKALKNYFYSKLWRVSVTAVFGYDLDSVARETRTTSWQS